ncbi:hypothetical protein MKY30_02280 [Oceanobacillus sp. FSL W8-0428]|uniref:hypothetical protein n=1 Tax=unclassified Oceanobacillus TaxID=2630292 RepID=UPI0030D899E8
MSRIFASLLAPIVLLVLVVIIALVIDPVAAFNQISNASIIILIFIYIVSFLFFFLLGAPLSIILDKLKGWSVLNYAIAGLIIGAVLEFRSYSYTQSFDWGSLFIYTLAALSYYISLLYTDRVIKRLEDKYS